MKNTASTTALAGDSTQAKAVVSPSGPCGAHLTDGKSPLPSEILLRLWTLYADAEMKGFQGELDELREGRGVQAGLVAALHAILPAKQFRGVMVQWEVDAIKLSELLYIAGGAAEGNENSIEV